MKDLRIALLLDSGPQNWSSREEFHSRLCRAMVERGATPVLIYSGALGSEVESRMASAGAQLVSRARLEGRKGYHDTLSRVLKRYRINLVHIRYFTYYSTLPWLVRSHAIRRIIYTEANSGNPTERSSWSWRRLLTRARTSVACHPIARFIAISHFVRERLVRAGVSPRSIRVIHNGVDVDRYAPSREARLAWRREHQIEDDEFVVLAVNRLDPIKRTDVVVRAFAELRRRGELVRLAVAGVGPQESNLRSLAEKLGVARSVTWLGYLKDPVVALQAGDILSLASEGEAFGFALAEAMACELPCVGSRSGGICEVIEDETTGLLATPGDPCSFADAFQRIAKDRPLLRSMGRAGARRVRQRFNVDATVEATIDVYRELLDY